MYMHLDLGHPFQEFLKKSLKTPCLALRTNSEQRGFQTLRRGCRRPSTGFCSHSPMGHISTVHGNAPPSFIGRPAGRPTVKRCVASRRVASLRAGTIIDTNVFLTTFGSQFTACGMSGRLHNKLPRMKRNKSPLRRQKTLMPHAPPRVE